MIRAAVGLDQSGKTTILNLQKENPIIHGVKYTRHLEPSRFREVLMAIEKTIRWNTVRFLGYFNKHFDLDRCFIDAEAYAIGLGFERIEKIFRPLYRGCKPDIVMFVDTPVEECIARGAQFDFDTMTKIRQAYVDFFERSEDYSLESVKHSKTSGTTLKVYVRIRKW